jgi:hypothetical protein
MSAVPLGARDDSLFQIVIAVPMPSLARSTASPTVRRPLD